MADLYRVIYVNKGGQSQVVSVVATSDKNAADAAKSADTGHQQHITATVFMHNIITGS